MYKNREHFGLNSKKGKRKKVDLLVYIILLAHEPREREKQ